MKSEPNDVDINDSVPKSAPAPAPDVESAADAPLVRIGARPKSRFGRRLLTFAIVVAFLAGVAIGAGALYLRKFRQPINPDDATPEKLVGWLALRDLSVESPETREKLFDKYFAGVSSTNAAGETRVEAPEALQKLAPTIMSGRDAQIADWEKKRTRPPYWRIDYVVVPKTPRTSEYVVSDDIQPGPSTIARWKAKRDAAAQNGDERVQIPGQIERNVRLLVFQWFVKRRREYDATPDADKKARLEKIAVELTSLQNFYNGLRDAAKLPPLTRAATLKEFESTIDGWFELTSPEELAKVLWFKDLLVSVAVAAESPFGKARAEDGTTTADVQCAYPPRVPESRLASERAGIASTSARLAIEGFRRFAFVENDGDDDGAKNANLN